MKNIKFIIGLIISIVWFIAYCGGGAYLLALQAIKNPNHVPIYMPFLILLWIVGFFIGYFILEYVIKKLLKIL